MLASGHNPLTSDASRPGEVRSEAFWDFSAQFGLIVASFPLVTALADALERPALWPHFLLSRCIWTLLILAFPVAATRGVKRNMLPWILYGSAVILLVLAIREQVWLGVRLPEIITTTCLVFVIIPIMGVPFSWKENGVGVLVLLLALNGVCLRIPGLSASLVRLELVALFLVIAMGFVHHRFEQMIEAQHVYQRQIEDSARKDVLTGLWNRRYFIELGDRVLRQGIRSKRDVSMVLLDLDHFKAVNDRYGHGAGDAVIRETARCMASTVRETDLVARIGGEEFVILLEDTGMELGLQVAERVRHGIEALAIQAEGLDAPLRVTASLGLACVEGPEETLDGLMSRADQALYRAKGTGRNRVVPYLDPALPPLGTDRKGTDHE